jgi:hypothetical protein
MRCRIRAVTCVLFAITASPRNTALADEGGVSFWMPGQDGSFAAVAPSAGWSLPLVFYNYGGANAPGPSCRAAICCRLA